jgi:hypothetical protein
MNPYIKFSKDEFHNQFCALQNEVDILKGKSPRNKYHCINCNDLGYVDSSYHGSPDFEDCMACLRGSITKEMNRALCEQLSNEDGK